MRYSSDLRLRILTFVENGGSKVEAAQRFGVSRASIYRWLNATDPLDYQKPGPRGPRLLDYQQLEQHVAEFPDLTQQERATHFGVSRACIGYGWQKIGCVRKKKTLGYKERCPDQRAAYRTQLAEIKQCGRTLVYVDESGFQAESIRRYAYAPNGQRVFDLISSQRFRKTTLVAARIADKFTAATLFEGSCNAERFNQWLEQELCPRLCWNHVVIMDNARSHKTKRTRALIESSGATLMYLPPYSPDYNPIEHDFATLKRSREYNPDKPLEDIIQMYQ